ncbi:MULTISPECIES: hypothetical protein [Staphylococcus]|jgi:hypothetical protein|uniref:Uncharacterized protein n=1 Tax=Staphylococcus hsinchuensis TaxID=3051183 RepID=A0ABZ3E9M4_9STAP|nr:MULTISPECIES: hypothetical protein [Staphylococcus]MBC3101984.1 hypothetical protein [Staphylococcus haemolyticus]MBC3142841.1 hypothetical protein [Staphylococcus haemolyticus]MBF8037164.1 hypothetical protein [Staphylococcus epidermidis]MBF8059075.1 hypothetical protein [Staphylococcus epidermidis]MCH4365401.1 hypothetical protein [Staphylococcus haemolyticus]
MSELSIEQRAHDLALLKTEILANQQIAETGTVNIELTREYAIAYAEAKDALEKIFTKDQD